MRVLVANAGSSSLKLSVLDADDAVLGECNIPVQGDAWERSALEEALGRFPAVDAVGHRVVHGGREFVEPVRLDADVVGRLRALSGLAPLHQPKSLAGIEVLERALPGVPAVACFDTAFHARMPVEAHTYAVPARWRQEWGCAGTGSTGSRTPTPGGAPGSGRVLSGWWWRIWVRVRRCRRCWAGGRWTPRWGSPLWRGW